LILILYIKENFMAGILDDGLEIHLKKFPLSDDNLQNENNAEYSRGYGKINSLINSEKESKEIYQGLFFMSHNYFDTYVSHETRYLWKTTGRKNKFTKT
jgi:hypothetical protein